MMNRTLSTLAIGSALMAASVVAGDELTVVSDRDNTLYEILQQSDPGNILELGVPQSNGAGEHFFVGVRAGQFPPAIRRGLIRFDVSSIPAGSTIDSVVLSLNMSRTTSGSAPVSLHRASSDWGEGTSDADGEEGSGADATPGDATWLHTFFDTDFWTSVGGDFAPAASASTSVGSEGPYTWGSTAAMEADVSAWVDDPVANFGWVVIGDENMPGQGQGSTSKRFDTREVMATGPQLQPQLVVNFTPPVPVELQTFDVD